MNKTKCTALMLCGLLALAGTVDGCGSGNRGRDVGDAPAQLFGTWRLVKITGGITGQGFPIPAQAKSITFDQDGTVTQTGGGVPTSQSTYHVTRRRTLLSSNIASVVEYDNGSLSQIIELVDDQQLLLVDEANDGTGQQYLRIIQNGGI